MTRRTPKPEYGFETRMVHAGAQPEPITGARQTPIFQNTSYVFHDADDAASLFNLQSFGFIYSRLSNPTVAVLEERLASLEAGRGTTCCASGHSAQLLAFFPLLDPGDRFMKRASRSLSITRWRHLTYVGQLSGAQIWSSIQRRSFSAAMARPWAAV